MRSKLLLGVLFLLCACGLQINAQTATLTAAQKVLNEKQSGVAFPEFSLFQWKSSILALPEAKNVLSGGQLLTLNTAQLENLFVQKPEAVTLFIPVSGNEVMEVELVQYDLFASGFKVATSQSNGAAVNYHPGVYYRGMVKNQPQTMAAISIFKNEIMGVISTPQQGNMVLGLLNTGNKTDYVLYSDQNLMVSMNFQCDTDDSAPALQPTGLLNDLQGMITTVSNCVRVYLECEYDMQVEKGGVTGTTNYMTGLFNVVSTLYQNEGITTPISEIFVWTTPDPYATTSTSDALNSFRNYRTSFNGDVAHLVSRGAPSGGGVAWVNALCTSYKYAYSYIYSSYSLFPTYSWSVEVITHEMGHNLGSQHTHACAWNGDNTAIDGCGPAAGYSEGCTAPVPTAGTIMSYCHLVSGVGINFTLGFGTQPGDRIRTRITNATCLTSCAPVCFTASTTGTNVDCNGAATGSATANVSGGTSPFSYSWSNGGTTQTINSLTAGTYTVTVSDGTGCTGSASRVVTQPTAIALSAAITDELFAGAGNGAVDLTVSGGAAPYAYAWSNGATTQDIGSLAAGTYTVTVTDANACTTVATYAVQSNGCGNVVNTFPYSEGFETGLGLWAQNTTDDFDWTRQSGGTPTSNTGPNAAFEGSFYLYTEATGNSPSKTAIITSACINLTNVVNPSLSFRYNMYGSNMGTLRLEAGVNGAGYTTVWSLSGNQSTSWLQATVNLSAYQGSYIKLRFVGITGGGQRSDMAIDALQLTASLPPCAAPVLTASATGVNCFGGNNGTAGVSASGATLPYTYAWSNGAATASVSGLTAGNYSVTVTDATGCSAAASVTVSTPTALSLATTATNENPAGAANGAVNLTVSGATTPYAYLWSNGATTEDISGLIPGTYTVTVTDAQGCTAPGSATVIAVPSCTPLATLPHTQNFESGLGNWQQDSADNFDWTIASGATPTSNTGPNSAYQGSFYAYTEATGVTGTANLISPCFDLSGATNPSLSFAYHMQGNQMGTLRAEVSTDAGISWTTLWSKSGNQSSNWLTASVSLSAYAGLVVKLRFSGTIGGNRSDMGIDAVQVNSSGGLPEGGSPVAPQSGNEAVQQLLLSPNPVSETLFIRLYTDAQQPATLQITDVAGRTIYTEKLQLAAGNNEIMWPVNHLGNGLYFVAVQGAANYTGKFMVLHR